MHLPKVEKTWSIGTILTTALAFVTLVTVVGNIWWNTFNIASNARSVPEVRKEVTQNHQDILLLKEQQQVTTAQYTAIMQTLSHMDNKLDDISRREAKNEGQLSRGP